MYGSFGSEPMHILDDKDNAIERVMSFSYELNRDKTRANAMRLIRKQAQSFGFEGGSMFYGTLSQHEFIDTRSSDFFEAVTHEALINLDPVAHITMKDQKSFLWNERVNHSQLSKKEREFMGLAAEFGVVDGIQIPYVGPGIIGGVLSFYGLYSDNARDTWHLHQFEMYQYAAILFKFCEDIGMAKNIGNLTQNRNPLSRNEKRALFAASRGMGYSKIAMEFGVDPETIKTHLKNARQKLGAENTAAAIAEAIRSGHII